MSDRISGLVGQGLGGDPAIKTRAPTSRQQDRTGKSAQPSGRGASRAGEIGASGALGARAGRRAADGFDGDGRAEILERLGECVIRLQGLLGELRDLLRALHEQQAREANRAEGTAQTEVLGAREPGLEASFSDAAELEPRSGVREDAPLAREDEPCGMRISYGGGASVLAGRPASAAAARAALVAADMAMAGYSREQIITRLIREGGPEAAAAAEQALE